jgi:hypothetical protein
LIPNTLVELLSSQHRYGATSFPSVPWIFPAIAIAVVTFGAYAIYLSVFTYFADVWVISTALHWTTDAENSHLISYTTYASSAMAAHSFYGNVLTGSLPLVVNISEHAFAFFSPMVPWLALACFNYARKHLEVSTNAYFVREQCLDD